MQMAMEVSFIYLSYKDSRYNVYNFVKIPIMSYIKK